MQWADILEFWDWTNVRTLKISTHGISRWLQFNRYEHQAAWVQPLAQHEVAVTSLQCYIVVGSVSLTEFDHGQ